MNEAKRQSAAKTFEAPELDPVQQVA